MNDQKNELKEIQKNILLILEDILLRNRQEVKNKKDDKNYLPYDGQAIEEKINKILDLKGKRSEGGKIVTYENDKYKFIKENSNTYVINKKNGEKVFQKGHFTKFVSNEDAKYLKNIQTLLQEIVDDLDEDNELEYDGNEIEESIEKLLDFKGVENDNGTIIYDTENYRLIKKDTNNISVINKQTGEVIFQDGKITQNTSEQDLNSLKDFSKVVEELEKGRQIQSNIEKIIELKGVDDTRFQWKCFETEAYSFIKREDDIFVFNTQNEEIVFKNGEFTQESSDEDIDNLNSLQEYVQELVDSLDSSSGEEIGGQQIQASIEKIIELKGVDDTRFQWKCFETEAYSFIKREDDIFVFNTQNEEIVFKNSEFTEKASDEDVEHIKSLEKYAQHLIDYPDSKYYGKEIEENIRNFLNHQGTVNDDTITHETKNHRFIKDVEDNVYIVNKQTEEIIFKDNEFTQKASSNDVEKINHMCEYAQDIIDDLDTEEYLEYSSEEIKESIDTILNEKGAENDNGFITYETKNHWFTKNENGDISVINKQTGEVIFQDGDFTQEASADDVIFLNHFCDHIQEIIEDGLDEQESEQQSYSPTLKLVR